MGTSDRLKPLLERNIRAEMGDGAQDEAQALMDETNIRQNDGRSLARTWISLQDVPREKRDKWRRIINNYHDGQTDPEKGKQNWHAGKINDARLFADQLQLASDEEQKLVRISKEVDFTQFGSFSNDQVLVAAASLVADENTDVYENRIILTDRYKELMEVVGLGSTQRRKIRQSLRERTDFF